MNATPQRSINQALEMGFIKETTALYKKGSKRFLISSKNKAQIILSRSEHTGPYRNSRKALPVGFPCGLYATNSTVDILDLDFVETVTIYKKDGFTLVEA